MKFLDIVSKILLKKFALSALLVIIWEEMVNAILSSLDVLPIQEEHANNVNHNFT